LNTPGVPDAKMKYRNGKSSGGVAGVSLQVHLHSPELLEKFQAEARTTLWIHDAPKDPMSVIEPGGEVAVCGGVIDQA